MDYLIFFIVFCSGLGFLFIAYKMLIPFLHSINKPMNSSTRFMMILILFGFGFILYEFSLGGMQVMYYYIEKSQFITGIALHLVLIVIALCSAMVIFRLTSGLINIISNVNVKAELIKNNLLIAGIFGLFFLILILFLKASILKLSLIIIS